VILQVGSAETAINFTWTGHGVQCRHHVQFTPAHCYMCIEQQKHPRLLKPSSKQSEEHELKDVL